MKIGRNDPCPCGSGKKYKHCCLNNPKIVPFPGNPSETHQTGTSNMNIENMPPVYQMMGFASSEAYDKAFGNLDLQKELSGAGSLEEARTMADKIINDYNSSLDETPYIPVDELIKELILKGPLKAKKAVTVNKNILQVDALRKTPIIQLSISYLEYIARNNGEIVVPKRRSRKFKLDSVISILREQSDIELNSRDSQGKPIVSFWYDLINIMLTEKGYISYSNSILSITDKGLKLLSNKGVKASYFQFLKFITEGINWFYDSNLHEEVEDFQNIAGFSLLIMNGLSDHNQFISAEDILKTVDSMYHILADLEKVHIDNKKAFEIFDDYFLTVIAA